jgi:hypothetical protein
MRKWLWLSVVVVGGLVMSCGKALPTLDGVDLVTWKDDKNACGDKRMAMGALIEQQKDKLLALSEDDIVAVLGKPDQNELHKRNQKFFYYFVQPSPTCGAGKAGTKRLAIRFNAMGLAKELAIQD